MNNNYVGSLREADQDSTKEKKPWVKPSIETIALESAENGFTPSRYDGSGHYSRHFS